MNSLDSIFKKVCELYSDPTIFYPSSLDVFQQHVTFLLRTADVECQAGKGAIGRDYLADELC